MVNVHVKFNDGEEVEFKQFKEAYIDEDGNAFLVNDKGDNITFNKTYWIVFAVTAS